MKKRLSILCLLLFTLCTISPAITYAEGANEVTPPGFNKQLDDLKKNSGILDGFIVGQVQNFTSIAGINSLQNLIFGNPYEVWMGDSAKGKTVTYGIFYDEEFTKIIKPMITIFGAAYVSFITLAILLASAKMGLKAYSPQAKSDFWQDVNMWVVSAFFMGTFTWFIQIMFSVNESLVQTILHVTQVNGADPKNASIIANFQGGVLSKIGDVIVFLAEWGLALYLNVIYIARKIVILFLMILTPVAAISLLYAKTRTFFGSWFKELAGNIFLQTIHAMVLGAFAIMAGMGAGIVFKLGMLIMFIPVTGMISRWLNLGDSSSKLGQAATMAGLGGVMGAAMLARGVKGTLSGARGEFNASRGQSDNYGSDSGTTRLTEAAQGTQSKGWQNAKNVMKTAGAIAGGAVGLTMGPAGVAVGGALGGKAGEMLTQGSRNLGAGMGGLGRTLASPYNKDAGGKLAGIKTGYSQMWNNLAERRQFMGNTGEALGSVVGQGERGRALGHMLSGASRNRVHAEQFGGKTLADYAKENPGGSVAWRQDNMGSGFYLNNGQGNMQLISPLGKADSTLKRGEVRQIDHQFAGSMPATRQENGSYTITSAGGAAGGGSREVVGFSGSTDSLMRKSDAYIVGSDGARHTDTRFSAKNVNPDDYFAHNVSGAHKRTVSDKGADVIANRNIKAWRNNPHQDNSSRHRGVV